MTQANPFETAGRIKKAYDIACHLHRAKITAEMAQTMIPVEWELAAVCAGYKRPPSVETIRICIEKLGLLEAPLGKSRGKRVEDDPSFAFWMMSKDFPGSTLDMLQAELDRLETVAEWAAA